MTPAFENYQRQFQYKAHNVYVTNHKGDSYSYIVEFQKILPTWKYECARNSRALAVAKLFNVFDKEKILANDHDLWGFCVKVCMLITTNIPQVDPVCDSAAIPNLGTLQLCSCIVNVEPESRLPF